MTKSERNKKILFASRAFESPQTEGGFLLLRDVAIRAAEDESLVPAFFSSSGSTSSEDGVSLLASLPRPGWSKSVSTHFVISLLKWTSHFDLVHTAHVPTPLNSRALARISRWGRRRGVRYVQTVTALPSNETLRKELFWGDAVVCLNATDTEVVSHFHENVRTIHPAPSPGRLGKGTPAPQSFLDRCQGKRIICIPVDWSRIHDVGFIVRLCLELLEGETEFHIVIPCRFDDERMVETLFRTSPGGRDRDISIVGAVDWMLDLLRRSEVVVYPIDDVEKKFNPPLVLLEAAHLGARVVTTEKVAASSALDGTRTTILEGRSVRDWRRAIQCVPEGTAETGHYAGRFEESYQSYRNLYAELLVPR